MEAPEGYAGHLTFYVAVPDVEAALAQAESLGGTRMMGPDEVMPGLIVGLFTDPAGHTVGVLTGTSALGLHQLRSQGSAPGEAGRAAPGAERQGAVQPEAAAEAHREPGRERVAAAVAVDRRAGQGAAALQRPVVPSASR